MQIYIFILIFFKYRSSENNNFVTKRNYFLRWGISVKYYHVSYTNPYLFGDLS